jgi:hypothetical protein
MSNVTLEKVLEEAKELTPDEQRQLREALEHEARSTEQLEKEALLRRIQSKYAALPTSSEEFARRKQEEIELEDRQRFNSTEADG